MSNAITEIDNTDLVFIFGYNPADSHPIVANHILNAKRNGAKIIVCDPRKIETARIADLHLALKNGSNIALLNAIGQVIIEEDLYDKSFVAGRSEGFEAYRNIVEGYTPESVETITGISVRQIRECARLYASAGNAMILWGMGVTQFWQGVETVRSLTSLAILTGNLGKPHVGVNPGRGQNNVQGACDMGALPDTYPGYQYVKFPENREKFANAWGVESLPENPGYRISELPHRVAHGEVRAAYIMGEDPLQTDAELSAVRQAFEEMELVIVQDIFMTKTAEIADVLLPATSWGEHGGVFTCADRGFQRFEQAIIATGNVKRDWEIISLLASEMGYPMHYDNNQQIWDEMRELCPLFYGVTYEKMGDMNHVQWPCPTLDHPGTPWLYKDNLFDTPTGKGQLFAAPWRAPAETPDEAYPLVLCTVREVGHYSCRSMTGNCAALQSLADEPGRVQINRADAQRLGIADQQLVWVSSRRGKVITRADISDRINEGAVYMTYQWWVGACNELTQDNLDPISKTPETKYCAVKVEAIADQRWAEQYAWTSYSEMKARLKAAVNV